MNLITQIKCEENCKLKAYLDNLGVPTIGWGHAGPEVRLGMVWTQQQADATLDADLNNAIALTHSVYPWVDQLDEVRRAVLIGMMFQMGPARLGGFVNTLKNFKAHDWTATAEGMRQSKWHSQAKNRVERLATQVETGEWPDYKGLGYNV